MCSREGRFMPRSMVHASHEHETTEIMNGDEKL